MRYTHTNINSPDWRRLSNFYKTVFGCRSLKPRDLGGDFFERLTALTGAHVEGEHILLPGYGEDGPTFEIFTYTPAGDQAPAKVNDCGFAHVAFEVDNVRETLQKLLENGGSQLGEVMTTFYPFEQLWLTLVYAKDPDGNIVEIQRWHQEENE
ncbi:MAG: VOC family protein [Christensenellaceae bacterium]|nr:VOC family protein [Christensenellaceae bacterium]